MLEKDNYNKTECQKIWMHEEIDFTFYARLLQQDMNDAVNGNQMHENVLEFLLQENSLLISRQSFYQH